MATLSFETLRFSNKGENVLATFLTMFELQIPNEALNEIGTWTIDGATISFDGVSEKVARRKFDVLLAKAFQNMRNRMNGKKTVYVHKGSGIPLLGTSAFGIIDRGTKTIEVRPITSCNIRCVFCSVDEDQRPTDFVVEAEYLVEETQKIIEQKKISGVEILINSQGEPTLYHDMQTLISGMRTITGVKYVTLITNGTLLPSPAVDKLLSAGLTRVNLSINAIDDKKAKKLADAGYSIRQVLDLAKYLSNKVELVIAPVWVSGWNDDEMDKIVAFVKTLENKKFKPTCCIQNFLPYKFGRNPAKSMAWDAFFEKLKILEKKHGVKLTVDSSDFPETLTKVGELPKPFRKGDIIRAKVIGSGRLAGETLAVASNRNISLMKYTGIPGAIVKVKIVRTKHNIFCGVVV